MNSRMLRILYTLRTYGPMTAEERTARIGNVRFALYQLCQMNRVERRRDGKYFVPSPAWRQFCGVAA